MATTNLNGRNCTTKTAIVKAAGNTTVLAVEELLFKKGQHAYFSFFRYKPALCLGVTTASSYCAPAPKPNQSLPKNVFVRHPANTNMFDEIMQGKHTVGVRVMPSNKIFVTGSLIARAVEALRASYQGYVDAQNKKFGNSRFKNIPCSMATNFCWAILHVIRHGLTNAQSRAIFRMGFKNHAYILKMVTKLTAPNLKKAIRGGANSLRR